MSILVSKRNPRQVVIKSRGRIGGKRASYTEIQEQIVKLAQDGIPISSQDQNITTIESITGKDRTTITRYINKAIKEGIIERDSAKKIKLTKKVEAQIAHEYLLRDNFKEKYPAVKNWVEKRELEAAGDKKKLRLVKYQLNALKVVCDTLKTSPYALLAEKSSTKYGGLEDAMALFKMHCVNGTVALTIKKKKKQLESEEPNIDSMFRNYLIVCRGFAMYNGIAIPKLPKTHILSGKKVSFGIYAHVKLSFAKIDEIVQYLRNRYGDDSRELAMFIFYYITGTRKNSIYKVLTSTVQQRLDGWLECKVYEPKTKTEWRKLIPNDNPHFDLLKNYMLKRVRQGSRYLFIESEKDITEPFKNGLTQTFKDAYVACKITEDYFMMRPTHALRHVSAHYWLERTEHNYVVVAAIVGWKDVQTLISCYGGITDDQIVSIIARSAYKHG